MTYNVGADFLAHDIEVDDHCGGCEVRVLRVEWGLTGGDVEEATAVVAGGVGLL